MHLKLKRIAPLRGWKILAAIYGLFSLIFVPFFIVFMLVSSIAAQQNAAGAPPVPFMFGMGLGMMIMMPIMYTAMGFVGGVLGAAIYNLIAKWLGGLELEFESKAFAPASVAVPPQL